MDAETQARGDRALGSGETSGTEGSWTPVPGYRGGVGTKMDWIQGLPFKSERGVEILPEETVKFYHDLHPGT